MKYVNHRYKSQYIIYILIMVVEIGITKCQPVVIEPDLFIMYISDKNGSYTYIQ
jgi:hypothetical protein